MSYITIFFEANDAWGFDLCSFKVNLIANELSISYRNNKGGYTTNGINLDSEQIKRIKKLAPPSILESFRDNKWKENRDPEFVLDGYSWKVELISNDGHPALKMQDTIGNYSPPLEIVQLVNYVLTIPTRVRAATL